MIWINHLAYRLGSMGHGSGQQLPHVPDQVGRGDDPDGLVGPCDDDPVNLGFQHDVDHLGEWRALIRSVDGRGHDVGHGARVYLLDLEAVHFLFLQPDVSVVMRSRPKLHQPALGSRVRDVRHGDHSHRRRPNWTGPQAPPRSSRCRPAYASWAASLQFSGRNL